MRYFFDAVPSLVDLRARWWRKHLHQGSKVVALAIECKIFRMFSDGVTSSSDSSKADAPSHDLSPDPKCVAANTFFFCESSARANWSLSAIISLCWLQEAEATQCSLTDITCEGGGTHCSTIMQYVVGACEAWAIGALPRFEGFTHSDVLVFYGILAFSGVLDCSGVLVRPEDGPCLDFLVLSSLTTFSLSVSLEVSIMDTRVHKTPHYWVQEHLYYHNWSTLLPNHYPYSSTFGWPTECSQYQLFFLWTNSLRPFPSPARIPLGPPVLVSPCTVWGQEV